MIDLIKINTQFNELVGYKEEQEVTLSNSQKLSSSGFFVNELSGVDLQGVQKSQWIKEDLTNDLTVSEYLDKIYNTTVLKTVYEFLNRLQAKFINTELKADKTLVNSTATGLKTQSEQFVGYRIKLQNSNTLRLILKSIALQCNKAQTVRIFLYEMSQKSPIFEHDLTISGDLAREYEVLTDKILKFADENGAGYTYLLGYYESVSDNIQTWQLDADSQAYTVDITNYEISTENKADIRPIRIDKSYFDWTGTTYNLPNIFDKNNTFSQFDSYEGLSFKFSIDCDYTDIITDNVNLFAQTLQYELALKIISDNIESKTFNQITESNRNQWNALKIELQSKLDGFHYQDNSGGKMYNSGLYDILIENFNSLDCECFKSNYIKFM